MSVLSTVASWTATQGAQIVHRAGEPGVPTWTVAAVLLLALVIAVGAVRAGDAEE